MAESRKPFTTGVNAYDSIFWMLALLLLTPLACAEDQADDDATVGDDDTYDPDDPNADWDGDGHTTATDCNDFDGGIHPDQAEVCGNGLDDDCNGSVDCEDPACSGEPSCDEEEPQDELCGDHIDNDEDMATDCDDPDCEYSVYCSPCSIGVSGTCGYSWNNYSVYFGVDNLPGYSCGGNEPGAEFIYEFLAWQDGTVTFSIDPEDPVMGFGGNDVNLYLLEGTCFADLCIGSSNTGGMGDVEEVTVATTAGTYYYAVIEKVGGSSNDMVFSTQCFP